MIPRCGTPIERAELAARAARAIARAAPGKSIAIAGAIGSLDRAIERTAALLMEAAIDRAVASSAALIVIDDVVAGLLAGRVAIDRVRGHCVLVDAGTTRADDGST